MSSHELRRYSLDETDRSALRGTPGEHSSEDFNNLWFFISLISGPEFLECGREFLESRAMGRPRPRPGPGLGWVLFIS